MRNKILRLEIELERTQELLAIYRTDALTGLKMRRDFEIRLSEFFASGVKFYLTLADVNGLHAINRDQGFDAGDALIKRVSNSFIHNADGISYRIGGDEFAAISIDAPDCICTSDYVCVHITNEGFSSEKEMFSGLDKLLIQKKEALYSSDDKDRRS